VALRNIDTSMWYQPDGTWSSSYANLPVTIANPNSPSTTWTFSWTPPAAGNYGVSLRVDDIAANTDPTRAWVPFSVSADTTAPNGEVTSPTNQQHVANGPMVFSGTATDNVGVSKVWIAIRNRTTLQWLQANMTTWGFGAVLLPCHLDRPRRDEHNLVDGVDASRRRELRHRCAHR